MEKFLEVIHHYCGTNKRKIGVLTNNKKPSSFLSILKKNINLISLNLQLQTTLIEDPFLDVATCLFLIMLINKSQDASFQSALIMESTIENHKQVKH